MKRGGSSADYFAPASFPPTSISADLGKLGRISVKFVPSGSTAQRTTCGSARMFESGIYEGAIEFRGEGGYTNFSATRIDGLIGRDQLLCVGN